MNKKRILIGVISCILLILLSGVHFWEGKEKKVFEFSQIPKKEYEYVNYTGIVQTEGEYLNFEYATDKDVAVYFEKDELETRMRNKKVGEIQMIIQSLYEICDELRSDTLCVYIGSHINTYGSNQKAYVSLQDVGTVNEIIAILQALSDETSNYGLCYGMASYLARAACYQQSQQVMESDIKSKLNELEEKDILDLTIPVFETVYFDHEQNELSYQIAQEFVLYLISEQGLNQVLKMIKKSADHTIDFYEEYEHEMNAWLKNIGVKGEYIGINAPITYRKNHTKQEKTYPYVIETPYNNAYFDKECKSDLDGELFKYHSIKEYLVEYICDIDELMKYLTKYFKEKPPVQCYFYTESSNVSAYYKEMDMIKYVTPYYSGTHEYTHYITMGNNDYTWLNEGVATFCDYYLEKHCSHRILRKLVSKIIEYANNNKDLTIVASLYEKRTNCLLTADVQLDGYLDTRAWLDMIGLDESSRVSNVKVKEGDELSYYESASMINYLINTYGENLFFLMYLDHGDLEKYYGKSYEQLKKEWTQYMNNIFK